MILRWIDGIPYGPLIVFAVIMLVAPVRPMPHVVEKLLMLRHGTLTRPIDIFDLCFHLAPTIVLIVKIVRNAVR